MNEWPTGASGPHSARGTAHNWVRQNILGLVAIFIALSGSAFAAQVATQHGAKTAKAKKGPRGPRGPAGPRGATGPQGPPGPSTGLAGGDLTGNYPNPEIGPGKVGSAELADFAVEPNNYAVTTPHVRVTNSANEPISSGADTVLSFDGERFDTGTLHDNSINNSRLTAPPGLLAPYLVTASVQFAASATGVRSVTLRKNGTTSIANDTRSAASSGPTGITISTVTFLGGGQYVDVVVNQTSGGTLDVVKSNEVSPEFALSFLPGND